MTILFVCTGNTCRSPMAAGIAEKVFAEKGMSVAVRSAGVMPAAGSPASDEAIAAARAYGADLSGHKSAPVTEGLISSADYVFTMTGFHKLHLVRKYPRCAEKIFTLSEFAGETSEVSDPIGGGLEVYKACAAQLERLIKKLDTNLF